MHSHMQDHDISRNLQYPRILHNSDRLLEQDLVVKVVLLKDLFESPVTQDVSYLEDMALDK